MQYIMFITQRNIYAPNHNFEVHKYLKYHKIMINVLIVTFTSNNFQVN